MGRRFNVSGMCFPDRHYMLPPLRRLPTVRALIEDQAYFVLHAPRQTGKSTALRTLAAALTEEGRYASLLLSLEMGAAFPDNIGAAEHAILHLLLRTAEEVLPPELRPSAWPKAPPGSRLFDALRAYSEACPRPMVLFLDEIDALSGETLISVLRQLRNGCGNRPGHFPWSLCLCGMRDVRDYKFASGGSERLNSASPFNVKDESLTLRNFTSEEIAELYAQHTADTGQVFQPEAVALVYELTEGQPWLVNALARQAVDVLVTDRSAPVLPEHIETAKELLIQRRDTHLDSLAERLREPRIRRIIEPMLIGTYMPMDIMNDDLVYARDMGLVADRPVLRIGNAIYKELIPRALTSIMQANLPHQTAWYTRPDGTLDMPALLRAFQRFFAENSEAWLGRYDYQEAGPHLMLMAFLQRIVNGGGSIQREFALGSGRADLLVGFHGERHALELKVKRGDRTLQEGIEQLSGYLDRLGMKEGYLILFDRSSRPFEEKLYETAAEGPAGQRIHVFGA